MIPEDKLEDYLKQVEDTMTDGEYITYKEILEYISKAPIGHIKQILFYFMVAYTNQRIINQELQQQIDYLYSYLHIEEDKDDE